MRRVFNGGCRASEGAAYRGRPRCQDRARHGGDRQRAQRTIHPHRAPMPPRCAACLLLILTFVSCNERAPVPGDTAVRMNSVATSASPVVDSSATTATPVADSGAVLALDGEGLRVFVLPSGSARLVPFGEPRRKVVALVIRLRGGRDPEMAANRECNATVASWPSSQLQLWFTPEPESRFVGWSVGGRAPADSTIPRLTTPSGIGLGSTRAALESVYVVRVARSSLGVEFSTGGLAGLLASVRGDAPIRNLWAGQVCLAR